MAVSHGLHMLGFTVGSDPVAPGPWQGGYDQPPTPGKEAEPASSSPGPWRDGYAFPLSPPATPPLLPPPATPPSASQKSSTAWYVVGGVAVLAVTVAFLVGDYK